MLALFPGSILSAAEGASKGEAEHVVLVVWDGMRPDFVAPQFCPTLYSLATNGVFFRNHHPAYISSTEVNGAALATGANPGRNGVLANTEYDPEFSVLGSYATEGIEAIRRGDLMTGGHYILSPTVAEILHGAGISTIVAGSKPVALFHDRSANKRTAAAKESITLYEGKTVPRAAGEGLPKVNDDKRFPTNITHPNTAQDNWTTRSLIHSFWKKGVPKYTLLWLSDPDKSQHETGVGSSTALAGIESSDKNLAEVIKALKEKGVWEKTDLMLVSDHGFSTIHRTPEVSAILRKGGFNAHSKFVDPEPGDVMVVGLGGSALFYVVNRDEAVIRRLVDFLQTTDFAGVIFSRLPAEGTFPLESIGYTTTNGAPDILISLRWSAETNTHGAPGLMQTVGGTVGKGSHASLSRFDMNNTLVATGPDFKKGLINDMPTGNVDVAPTILWLLGVKPPASMDGRVLHEALARSSVKPPKAQTKTIEASREIGLFRWQQYLRFSTIGTTRYFDEGNGRVSRR
ncbi:MAG TPA: alkaline phosphatase family protein [Candidatus Limnocylindria bacterium]|nr:alkaline phosphatase family protein [Candidatus Limnocylindria bacterium]